MERALVTYLRKEAGRLEDGVGHADPFVQDHIRNLDKWATSVDKAITVDERAHARRAIAITRLMQVAGALNRAEGIPYPTTDVTFLLQEMACNIRFAVDLLSGEEK
jgi:hypothetical protein